MPPPTTDAALNILRRAKTVGEITAALQAAAPDGRLREALAERYDDLAAHPKRDPSASLRGALLRGLTQLTTTCDRARLEKALVTYEFGPQGENASGLRAAALLALAQLNPNLAETHAVHLLGDRRTEKMSGEPALTAVRFLAARGAIGPLYLYALQGGATQDVLAETLRSLVDLPAALVLELAERLGKSDDVVALVGLFDLLTAHGEPAAFARFVREWAMETRQLDVLHFAAAQAVASRCAPLVEALQEAAKLSGDPERRKLLTDALSA
jgi:hypothetical protein